MQLENIFTDYELIDSGGFEKLERFGAYVLSRPEPQAVWRKALPESEWNRRWQARFTRSKENAEAGQWELKTGMKEQWFISYSHDALKFSLRLGLTAFKHVGVFPEQAANWNYIYEQTQQLNVDVPRVLNLFAYTGGASLAAKAAGADVTHLDSVKPVVSWARENMEASKLDGIRWLIEDALKFVKKEVRRGKTYHGIILDPPAYGRGPEGEKWILERDLGELLEACSGILEKENAFLVINLYSMGFSPLITENIIHDYFPDLTDYESGELYVSDQAQRKLPLGTFLRFSR